MYVVQFKDDRGGDIMKLKQVDYLFFLLSREFYAETFVLLLKWGIYATHIPAHPGGPRGIRRPEKIHNHSNKSWVFHKTSVGRAQKTSKGRTQEAKEQQLYSKFPPGWQSSSPYL